MAATSSLEEFASDFNLDLKPEKSNLGGDLIDESKLPEG